MYIAELGVSFETSPRKGMVNVTASKLDSLIASFIKQFVASSFRFMTASHRVLSYRYDPTPSNPKYLFKPKISRWFTFEGVTLTFVGLGKHLLVTDVSNFFENIFTCAADQRTRIRGTGNSRRDRKAPDPQRD